MIKKQFKKTLSSFKKAVIRKDAGKTITKAKHKVFGKPAPTHKIVKRVTGWKTVAVKRKGKWVQEKRPVFGKKKVRVKIKSKKVPRRTGGSFIGF